MKLSPNRPSRFDHPASLITVLVLAAALWEVAAQYFYQADPNRTFGLKEGDRYNAISLWYVNRRATALSRIKDPIARDELCLPNSSSARMMAVGMSANDRIFLRGVLDNANPEAIGMYLIMQNYLFPREVEISLDGRAVLEGSVFKGVPASLEELAARGYDYVAEMRSPSNMGLLHLGPPGTQP